MDSQNTIVACAGTKLVGWSWSEDKSVIYGDKEWAKASINASASRKLVNLHAGEIEGVADLSNPKNIFGVFLALADFPRESIQLLVAPHELLERTKMEIVTLDSRDGLYDDFENILESNYLADLHE